MKNIAVVFAGGVGSRMRGNVPKQFLEVGGKPIIIQTLEIFEANENIDEIYVVCIESHIETLEKMIKKFNVSKISRVVPGGETGQDSIYNGLLAVRSENEDANILLCDGVRPLISQKTVNKCVEDLSKFGSAVTVMPVYETPVTSEDGEMVSALPARANAYVAQAPQCFNLNALLSWHEKERMLENPYENIVDSCGLAFKYGLKPHMTIGNRGNIKVTTIEDYLVLISNAAASDYEHLFELAQNQ